MDLGIRNKTAFIAAASRGLGRGCAEALAEEGARVAICSRHRQELEQTAREIGEKTGTDVLAVHGDVTEPAEIANAVESAAVRFGPVDILVTNAGGPPSGYFDDFRDEDWEAAFRLNFLSAVRMIRKVLPEMRRNGWGRIINLTSVSVKEPIDNLVLSNSVRASVHGLAKTLSRQEAGNGITVNNVMPGFTRTDRVEELVIRPGLEAGKREEQVLKEAAAKIPAGRIGTTEEFGALVAFLASQWAGYINGVSIPIDGGSIHAAF
jgi:3-oxoacyl-[acyl-carrier protein] reductase